jgi:hypothetical protein
MLRNPGPILLALLLPASGPARAQSCEPPKPQEAIAQVSAPNERYIEAARTGNSAWFDEYMSPEVLVILGGGQGRFSGHAPFTPPERRL